MIAICVVGNGAEDGIKLGSGGGAELCEGAGDLGVSDGSGVSFAMGVYCSLTPQFS